MWSSTASTDSTIPIDNNYQRPDADDILNECCKERFYRPPEQFDYNWSQNVFENSLTETVPKIPIELEKLNICQQQISKDDLIINWANKNLNNDNRTFNDINKNDSVHKKEVALAKKNLGRRELFWPYPNTRCFNEIPFIERSYCYPKIMCHLGSKSCIHAKNIISYIQHGITLFLIDLRYGSSNYHSKMIARFEKIRKFLDDSPNKLIFGLAFLIHGRRLEVGLMYKKQSVFLDNNSKIILTANRQFSDRGTNNIIYVNFSDYIDIFEPKDEIRIGNDIIVIVQGKSMNSIICIVKKSGLIKSGMVVRIPFNRYIVPAPLITKEEDEDIAFAISMDCDYLISTCVTSNLRSHIDWALAINNRLVILLQIISFSESPIIKTYDEINDLFNKCDGFYIYGDSSPKTYPLQKYTMEMAIQKQKLIIQASYMTTPYNKIIDKEALKYFLLYPDCIVFSPHIYDVTNIRSTIRYAYPDMNRDNFILSLSPVCQHDNLIDSLFCRQINLLAACEKVSCIIVINNSGHFVRLLAESRTMVPIIASFTDTPYAKTCLHSRNVYVTIYRNIKPPTWHEEVTMRLKNCIRYGKMIECIQKNVPFILCFSTTISDKYCNTVRILLNYD